MNNRRALYAAIVGVVFALAPMLVQFLTESSPLRTGAGLFMAPGALVGIGLAGGTVHAMSYVILVVVNFVFYSGLGYLVLTLMAKRRVSP